MQIETNFQTVRGKHKELPFELEGGVLKIGGTSYSKSGIQAIVEIANLLEHEGFSLIDKLPVTRRRGHSQFGGWPFDSTTMFYDSGEEQP